MTTLQLLKKLTDEVEELREDIVVVKSTLAMFIPDTEGQYQASFIKKMVAREKEKPTHQFTKSGNFLRHVYGGKK